MKVLVVFLTKNHPFLLLYTASVSGASYRCLFLVLLHIEVTNAVMVSQTACI